MHSGFLKIDSPALFSRLAHMFTGAECDHIASVYAFVSEVSSLAEPSLTRESENFNPKPARLVRLLLDTANPANALEIGAAIMTCVQFEIGENSSIALDKFNAETELALAAIRFDGNNGGLTAIESTTRIALTLALDSIRHLHMEISRREMEEPLVTRAQALLSFALRNEYAPKLRAMLTHAIQQQTQHDVEISL